MTKQKITEDQVKTLMAQLLRQPVAKLASETPLNTLVAESLMLVEMVIGLQEELGVRLTQDQLKTVQTVGNLVSLFTK